MRFSPVSEKDRPVKLLLCAAPETLQAMERVNDVRGIDRIIQKESILLHKRKFYVLFLSVNRQITMKTFTETVRVVDFGRMVEYQADLLLPTNKKIDCKVKYLKHDHEKELVGFLKLANFSARLDSPYIIRLFGIMLESQCLVLESYQSDLKWFLRERKARREEVPTVNLIDAAQCLAKALYYLVSEGFLRVFASNLHFLPFFVSQQQDIEIVHGQIRCCNVFVQSYKPNSSLVVKLGDPGLPRSYDITE